MRKIWRVSGHYGVVWGVGGEGSIGGYGEVEIWRIGEDVEGGGGCITRYLGGRG